MGTPHSGEHRPWLQPDAPQVSVIVVSHDSGADLGRCAESVLRQPLPLELVVVDNASSDGAPAALPADPRIRLLLNPDNRGFSRACNQGATLSRADALLFLNPDCVLPDDALPALLATLHAHPDLGILGAQLLNPDGSPQAASRRSDPTPAALLRRLLRRPDLAQVGRRAAPPVRLTAGQGPPYGVRPTAGNAARELTPGTATGVVSASGAAEPLPVDYTDAVSGALMLLPRRVFDALDGFDEGYVLHCEDLDLCRRARQAGHAVALAPSLQVPHAKGTSSRRRPIWVEWQKHRGMWRYFRRFDAPTTPRILHPLLWLALWTRFTLTIPRALLTRPTPMPPPDNRNT